MQKVSNSAKAGLNRFLYCFIKIDNKKCLHRHYTPNYIYLIKAKKEKEIIVRFLRNWREQLKACFIILKVTKNDGSKELLTKEKKSAKNVKILQEWQFLIS